LKCWQGDLGAETCPQNKAYKHNNKGCFSVDHFSINIFFV